MGTIEGAAAYLEAGRLRPVSSQGRFILEAGGTFAAVDGETNVFYHLARVPDASRKDRRDRWVVTWWLAIKPQGDVANLYAMRGWEVENEVRRVALKPLPTLMGGKDLTVSDRFLIDEDEIGGRLRIHVFRGGQEIAQGAGRKGRDTDAREFFEQALRGDTEALLRRSPADMRAAVRALKPAQINAIVQAGHVEVVKRLLNSGLNVRSRDNFGRTPLFAAVGAGRTEVVNRLLAAGAEAGIRPMGAGHAALTLACELGHTEIVRQLLAAGAKPNAKGWLGMDPLWFATYAGHHEIIDALLAAGAKWPTDKDRLKSLLRMMASAIRYGHGEVVERLLAAGVDPDMSADNAPLLIMAAYWVQPDLVQILLNAGADKNRRNAAGETALMIAAMRDRLDMMHILFTAGADINATNHAGQSALLIALEANARNAVQALQARGADTEPVRKHGQQALIQAMRRGDRGGVESLRQMGARLKLDDPHVYDHLVLAIAMGFEGVMADVLDAGWGLDRLIYGAWSIRGVAQRYEQAGLLDAFMQRSGRDAAPMHLPAVVRPVGADRLQLIKQQAPVYPRRLIAEQVSGEAVVDAYVHPDGSVVLPSVRHADRPEFGEAAAMAAVQWRFAPSGTGSWRRVQMPFGFTSPELGQLQIFDAITVDQLPAPLRQDPVVYPPNVPAVPGLALLELLINDEGGVHSVRVMALTETTLLRPIMDAALNWQYRPAVKEDQAVWIRLRTLLLLPESRSISALENVPTVEPVDRKTRLPRLIAAPNAELPAAIGQSRHIQVILLSCEIGPRGIPENIDVVANSSDLMLQGSVTALTRWRFDMGRRGSEANLGRIMVPFIYVPPDPVPLAERKSE